MTTLELPSIQRTAYGETVSGLLRLHRYVLEKNDDTPEYHDLCAALEAYWHELSPFEQERMGGLSQDLYTVSDPPPSDFQPMTPDAHGELREVYESRERGEWDRALTLLRQFDKILPPPLIAYLRGTIWGGLEEPQVAVVFHERAHQLAPENAAFLATFVTALAETDLGRALKVAEPIIANSAKLNGNIVVQAVQAYYRDVAHKPIDEATGTLRRLIEVLKGLLARAAKEKLHPDAQGPYPYLALSILASFHRMLGEVREAYDCYSQLIRMDPRNDIVIAARGALVYGSNPSAIADFELAVKLNTQIIWPYYYLAHHLLPHGQFEECLKMCVRGLDKPAPPRIRSALLEFLAISMAGLGHASDAVQRTFEDARRADPSNDRASENLRRYTAGVTMSKTSAVEWEYPSASSIRLLGEQLAFPTYERRRPVQAGV
jgi:tetratricopeptide (TPR) repeat protein